MEKFEVLANFFDLFSGNTDEKVFQSYKLNCDNIMNIVTKEQKKFDEYFADYSSRIVKTEYGTDSFCVPRGYYCPSKIIDVISNAKRGRLVKRGKYDFIYNFDKNGQLIFVQRSNAKACEFIQRIDNLEIGITFRRRNKVEAISECEFDAYDRIKRYSYYFRDLVEDKNMRLEEEIYEYKDDEITVTVIRFTPENPEIFNKTLFSKEKYVFTKIDEKEFQYSVKQIYPVFEHLKDITYRIKGTFPFD